MDELIKALTEFLKTATAYLEKGVQPALPLTVSTSAAVEMPATPVKERKPRAKRTDVEASAAQEAPATPVAAAEMTEEQSTEQLMKVVGPAFIKRFNKPTVDGKTEGYDAIKKLTAEKYKVGKLADLVHAQRLQLIVELKAKIAEADKAPA